MEIWIGIIATVVALALVFDFTNGFHDASNAIATIVTTGSMSMRNALIMAGVFNVLGALCVSAVAQTMETAILRDVGDALTSQLIVLAALCGAILWNITTWYFALPSSSSHALIGGLIGAGLAYQGPSEILVRPIFHAILIPMIISPILGGVIAALLIWALTLARRFHREPSVGTLRKLHLGAGALMAFSYSSNDAQKTMGVITLALIGANLLPKGSPVPLWVILVCALAITLGTLCGGRRIIETAGRRITLLDQEKGFAANVGASLTILFCSHLGFPIATTQVVVGGITGVGLASRSAPVSSAIWKRIGLAWLLTAPGAALIAALVFQALKVFR